MKPRLSKTDSKPSGQATVEYLLMLSVIVLFLTVLSTGFGQIRKYLLKQIICEVAAPCPTCPPPQSVKDKLGAYPGPCGKQL